jgi:hypothetical protein
MAALSQAGLRRAPKEHGSPSGISSNRLRNSSERALPGLFTHIAWTLIPEQCVINVGLSGPLFGAPGGGFQAEYVAGPAMTFNQAVGNTGTTALETRSRRNL